VCVDVQEKAIFVAFDFINEWISLWTLMSIVGSTVSSFPWFWFFWSLHKRTVWPKQRGLEVGLSVKCDSLSSVSLDGRAGQTSYEVGPKCNSLILFYRSAGLLTCLVTSFLTYLLTYLHTPWRKVLLEKLTVSQLVKTFPAFYGSREFITVFTTARHLSLS
jgi:hypothetical protein